MKQPNTPSNKDIKPQSYARRRSTSKFNDENSPVTPVGNKNNLYSFVKN